MEHGDIEQALADLETRIERLRALYEQYFMGLEKLEPLVVRKDLERRMNVLRREQIRNTALRFKFQMLIQRYNTLQQYWGRITREIDSGTYRRDVIRAAARFGEKSALTILGRKRAERYASLAEAQKARQNRRPDEVVIEEIEEVEAEWDDDEEAAKPATKRSHHIVISGMSPPAIPDDTSVTRTPIMAISPPPLPPRPPADRQAEQTARKPAEAGTTKRKVAELAAQMKAQRAARADAAPMSKLDLDLDLGPSSRGPKSKRSSSPPSRRAGRSRSKSADSSPPSAAPRSRAPTSRKSRSRRTSSPPTVRPAPATVRPAPATVRPAPATVRPAPATVRPAPATVRPAPATVRPAPATVRPAPATVRPAPATVRPAPATVRPAPPTMPPAAAPKASSARRETQPPAPEPKATRPRPAPNAPPAARTSPQQDAGLPDARLRQIYAKYVETKRSVKESTAGVTYEKLAESLRAQATKLRSAHPSKSVDYEVVIKDGKTLLKPIIR